MTEVGTPDKATLESLARIKGNTFALLSEHTSVKGELAAAVQECMSMAAAECNQIKIQLDAINAAEKKAKRSRKTSRK